MRLLPVEVERRPLQPFGVASIYSRPQLIEQYVQRLLTLGRLELSLSWLPVLRCNANATGIRLLARPTTPTETKMHDKDNLFALRRCIKLAREQAACAAQDAETHHIICRVHGPDTDEVDVRAVERSLSERSWMVGELAREALGQLESRGIDPKKTYLQAAEDGADRDLALFMDEGSGPLVALLTDAVQHLEKAEQASKTSADTAGSHLALATIQAQLVAMLLGAVGTQT